MKTKKSIIIFVITLVMLNNVEHLAVVHHAISHHPFPWAWANKLHSVIVVIIFEVVIITFVMEGKTTYSKIFAACIFILSMIYYDAPTLWVTSDYQGFISAVIYSFVFTISIYMFSEMLAGWYAQQSEVSSLAGQLHHATAAIEQHQAESSTLRSHIDQSKAVVHDLTDQLTRAHGTIDHLQRELEQHKERAARAARALQCPYCRQPQDSEAQLRSHKGHCPQNPRNQ